MTLLAGVWLLIVAGLVFRAARQGRAFRQLAPAADAGRLPALAVIVPARNEARNIEACIASLLDQRYAPDRLEIIIVDDNSTDGTATLAATTLQHTPHAVSARVLEAPPPPRDWRGKPHACDLGARHASCEAHWLCFVDADVRAGPDALASAVRHAQACGIQFLSLAPRQLLLSFAERLVIPCVLCILAFAHDVHAAGPDGPGVSVAGPFMLVRRDLYARIGGHAAARGEIAEDVVLARLAKASGARVDLLGGDRLAAVRMYGGAAELWQGLSRSAVEVLGGSVTSVALALAVAVVTAFSLAVTALAALHLSAGHDVIASIVALSATACAIAFHVAAARHFGIPGWYGLLYPLGDIAAAAIAINGVRQRVTGRLTWRGRTVRIPPSPTTRSPVER